jgi:hypothetical protein
LLTGLVEETTGLVVSAAGPVGPLWGAPPPGGGKAGTGLGEGVGVGVGVVLGEGEGVGVGVGVGTGVEVGVAAGEGELPASGEGEGAGAGEVRFEESAGIPDSVASGEDIAEVSIWEAGVPGSGEMTGTVGDVSTGLPVISSKITGISEGSLSELWTQAAERRVIAVMIIVKYQKVLCRFDIFDFPRQHDHIPSGYSRYLLSRKSGSDYLLFSNT